MSVENTANGVVIHIGAPDDTFIQTEGPFAGLRMKLIGGGVRVNSRTVTVVNHNAGFEPPAYFDPAYAATKQIAPDPLAAEKAAHNAKAAAKPVLAVETVQETETYTSATPTEANPFADIQITVDEDVPLPTNTADDTIVLDELGEEQSILDVLIARDSKNFGITPDEFNSIGLTKRKFWKLYEQVIGQTTNRPDINVALASVLRMANANAADYSRVVSAIKRIRDAS